MPVESLTMEETEVTVKTNEAYQLHAWVLPENATTQDLTWSSSNSSVVRVSENGEITGMKAGQRQCDGALRLQHPAEPGV